MAQSTVTTLSSLPYELLELTTADLAPEDLLNLRLVCKDISAKCEKQMARKNFSRLHIMPTLPQSLEQALAMTSRKYICSQIKQVVIWVDQMMPPRKCPRIKRQTAEETRTYQHERQIRLDVFAAEQMHFVRSGEDAAQLLGVFQNINDAGGEIDLEFRNLYFARLAVEKPPKAFTDINVTHEKALSFRCPDDVDVVLRKIFDAVEDSHVPLTSLGLPRRVCPEENCAQSPWPTTLTASHTFVTGLKHLKLHLDLYNLHLNDNVKLTVTTLIDLASTLQTFELHLTSVPKGQSPGVGSFLNDLVQGIHSSSLAEFTLRAPVAPFNPDVMLEFLVRHNNTLRSYAIPGLSRFNDPEWDLRVRDAGVNAIRAYGSQ